MSNFLFVTNPMEDFSEIVYNSNMTPQFRSDRLKTLMEKRDNLTNGQLEYMSGVSSTMIWNLQNGNRPNVSAVIVAKIAEALDCSVYYLLGLTDDPRPLNQDALVILQTEARAISEWPPSVRELAEIASKLPAGMVDALIALARQCAEVRREKDFFSVGWFQFTEILKQLFHFAPFFCWLTSAQKKVYRFFFE